MTKGINLTIKETRDTLLKDINKANLPISITVMILEKLLNEAQTLEKQVIEDEQKAFNDEIEKKEVIDEVVPEPITADNMN